MKRFLIAGVNGFVGHHVASVLKAHHFYVCGTGRQSRPKKAVESYLDDYIGDCDLKDESTTQLDSHLRQMDCVINLAGLAKVGSSFNNTQQYLKINVSVHTNLANRILELNLGHIRIISASSGAVYDSSQQLPLDEDGQLNPLSSPYAMSKIAMENEMLTLRDRGLDILIARPFNHIGPGQEPGFLVPDLFTQLKSSAKVVKAGNLKTRRDYTDVRDVARAYMLLAITPALTQPIYNICSGKSLSGEKLLECLQKISGIKKPVEVDRSKIRPTDAPDIYGSFKKLNQDTGWRPEISLKQTLEDFISS